jgi:Class II Aldolase and Adducin N-terminal domain
MLPRKRAYKGRKPGRDYVNHSTDFASVRGKVSDAEWQARLDLAACYRLVDKYGMTDLIYNHITARIPGTKDHLLINLYGLLYKEITASSLVKIHVDGDVVWKPETEYDINKSGYVIHGAIHKARPGVACCTRNARQHGGRRDAMRAAAAVANRDPLRRAHRLSRL